MGSFYCTYCSRDKRMDESLLPAIQRYISNRINYTAKLAETDEKSFLILSGEYGLITPDQLIPYYDHLLKADEVSGMVEKVTRQVVDLKVEDLTFFYNDLDDEPDIKPYYNLIHQACSQLSIVLKDHRFLCRIED